MRKKFVLIVLFFSSHLLFAQIKAGEITFTHVSGNTYQITTAIYIKTSGPPIDSACVYFGDSSLTGMAPLVSSNALGNDVTKNVYVVQHTYPGASVNTYLITAECSFRVAGINNIPSSASTVFYIKSELYINPFLGVNNSPVFLNPSVDSTCVNNLYSYNPGTNDVDGDSLYYTLQQCLKEVGQPIPGYVFPQASNSFVINNFTGDVTWDTPLLVGLYNFDVLVEEYRNGFKIGSVLREMQIDVKPTCVVGINKTIEEKLNLQVYPNPFNNEFTINYKLKNSSATLSVYNLMGAKIISQIITNNISYINLSNLVGGIYFLKVIDGNSIITKKVIKQ